MSSAEETIEKMKQALMDTNLVHQIVSVASSRRMEVSFFAAVPDITVSCGYGDECEVYAGKLYCRYTKWKSVDSAIRSIKRKHKQYLDNVDSERRTYERKLDREMRETSMKIRAEEKFGGKAQCIVGLFGRNFSIRVHLDEDQVMRFLEHNKQFIDDNGHWTI